MRRRWKISYVILAEAVVALLLFAVLIVRTIDRKKVTDEPESKMTVAENSENSSTQEETNSLEPKKYIKWVDFNICCDAMNKAYQYDVETHNKDVELHWIELLAYLACKNGGDFSKFKEKDMTAVADKLLSGEATMESLTADMKYYSYYLEAYTAVLGGLVGEYEIEVLKEESEAAVEKGSQGASLDFAAITSLPGKKILADGGEQLQEVFNFNVASDLTPAISPSLTNGLTPVPTIADKSEPEKVWVSRYGLKAFSPIAKGYYYYDYDDFGVARSYGYKRKHLGHDMMGEVGTPIIAVESGYVEALGWNQYGGWRIGIRSFDKKRYYYYAHLRKNFPYNKSLEVGSIVTAGDVIGYLGRTGYSTTENINNIETAHLHFGIQLIFDESQKEGNNEIWIDIYSLTKFLYKNRVETVKNGETKEYSRIYDMKDPAVEEYEKSQ